MSQPDFRLMLSRQSSIPLSLSVGRKAPDQPLSP
jgi:hypothetical protein